MKPTWIPSVAAPGASFLVKLTSLEEGVPGKSLKVLFNGVEIYLCYTGAHDRYECTVEWPATSARTVNLTVLYPATAIHFCNIILRPRVSARITQQELERRFFELLAATIQDFKPVSEWIKGGEQLKLPYLAEAYPDETLCFENQFRLPAMEGTKWLLRLDITGNGLLLVDGEPYQGVDEQHRIAVLEPGERSVALEATPRRLFGESPWFFAFTGSNLAAVHWEGFNTALALWDTAILARRRQELRQTLAKAAVEVELTPSVVQVYALQRTLYGYLMQEGSPEYGSMRGDLAYIANVYGERVVRGALEDTPKPSISELLETLNRVKAALPEGFPVGKVYLFGHAHIDTAWLWPFSETKRKVVRTFTTVARLAKMGYSFTYVQSGAQNYKWLEEQNPKLFDEIRGLVKSGHWLPIGGMWVESDTQLVTGESLARQFLYGQQYFKEKFGLKSRIGWLPDSFGFSAQLPQLMKKSGIEVFVTHKVMWYDTNEFPYHAFVWEGLDGSEVIAHIIVSTYNGALTATELAGLWDRYKQKDVAPAVHAYGFGDGGGGPTFLMLERLKHLKKLPGLPEPVEAPKENEYVADLLNLKPKLPRWKSEIYNEFHRGVYTTNIKVKSLMAEAEREAVWAEAASAIADFLGLIHYPREALKTAWERVLRCQFHDVLPGSSNYEAYEEAYRDLEEAIREFLKASSTALKSIADHVNAPKSSLIVFNSLPWLRTVVIEVPNEGYSYPDGRPVKIQKTGGKILAEVEVPSMGYIALAPSKGIAAEEGVKAYMEGDCLVLENDALRLKVTNNGSLVSIYDKQLQVELLRGPSNLLKAHVDKPGNFDAWDVDRSTVELPGRSLEIVEKPRITAEGPLIASVEYALKFKNSIIKQRITLYRSSRLIEFHTEVDWRDKCYLLKAWFNFNIKSGTAHFEVPFGVVERATTPKDKWDEAKYEVPALRWMDISDGVKGVSVIAPTRHGYSIRGAEVGLSLLKSPIHPNPWSDLGRYTITYYLYPHPGDYRTGRVYEKAYEIWSDVKTVVKERDSGNLPSKASFMEGQPGILVESLKMSENGEGLIIRMYEIEGRERSTLLRFPEPLEVYETNILEEDPKPVPKPSRARMPLTFITFKPFEIKTLLLKRQQ
ncbi:MAG: glycoside hydrolase family 38 C-terminal domain-containing protein [Thermofilaceae archaeon]